MGNKGFTYLLSVTMIFILAVVSSCQKDPAVTSPAQANSSLNADSSIESALNLNIATENMVISTQQISLTAELDSANEILQGIPANLNDVAELYSSITGYVAPTG